MLELTAETTFYVLQKLPELNDLSQYFNLSFRIEVIAVMIMTWLVLRQLTKAISPSHSSKILVLIHAFIMLAVSSQALYYMCSKSLHYADIYLSMHQYNRELEVTTVFGSYVSLAYFIHDSFYIHGAYIKHHIGASLVYFICFYHTDVSLLHCIAGIGFFEFGAVLVQISRAFPKSLTLRTFVCVGYAASRISLGWYYGYIYYQCQEDWNTFNIYQKLGYIPIFISIIFLLVINFRWTFLQWKSLVKAYTARFSKQETESFFEYHQKILGNVPVPVAQN